MDYFRERVSQKKIRLKDGIHNLDLSYITPRIIAMAFPASGIESAFRNHIDDVFFNYLFYINLFRCPSS